MAQELVRYAVSDAIAEITLDRAPVNALSLALIDALLAALAKARDDETVRAVIVCQRPQGVLRRARSRYHQGQARDRDQGLSRAAVFRAQRHSVPDGQADHRGRRRCGAGGWHDHRDLLRHGHCRRRRHLRLSRDRCRPDPGAAFRATAAAGRQASGFWSLFLGDPFDAATAFRMGLVSEVVPKGTALERARAIALRFAAKSPS